MNKYRIFPFYFPQFYPVPENDSWWGEGFTDWQLVQAAKAIHPAQIQPRVPLGNNYYDQSELSVIASQAELAKRFGVSGFNFYHYWFDGKLILEKPVENLLSDKSIDIEYFFTWANETWTRQWIGKPNDILIQQHHFPDERVWAEHYEYLRRHFLDDRYVKIDNKPVLCIYRAELIKSLDQWVRYFNARALEDGFNGVHLMALRSYEVLDSKKIYSHFDAIINFQPRYCANKYLKGASRIRAVLEKILRRLPEGWQIFLASKIIRKSFTEYKYKDYLDSLTLEGDLSCDGKVSYQVAFPDWDNAPRYNDRATFFSGIESALFEEALKLIKSNLVDQENKFIFINAWNEWSEGAYLEPDMRNGYEYLEIIKKTFSV